MVYLLTVPLSLLLVAEGFCPTRLLDLRSARDGQRIRGHILRDHRARRSDGPVADLDRRHQCGVRTNESPRPNIGDRLGEAVIVAGDGAGADIGPCPHPRIAKIAEM